MSGLNILISGGGIAGPAAGFWLAKAGANVTIIERAPNVRTAGQNVDIRGAAREIVKKMGLEEEIVRHHTTEEGVVWVDSENNYIAPFPASHDGTESFTAEVEILRSDLAEIMYDATRDKCNWEFGDYITKIEEFGDKVQVTMNKGSVQEYDLVIAADGLGSKTRSLAMPDFGEQWINRTGMYMGFFSVPKVETDTKWCRWYTAPGSKSVMLRPDNKGTTRIVLCAMNGDPRLEEVLSKPQKEQKALMRDLFQGSGWELDRLLDGMDTSDDYYYDKIAQIKAPSWHRGRVVLLGDAGYSPSPITGMGTSVAITGAYVLAGEIAKTPNDLQSAMQRYEDSLRPFVEKAQKIFPGAPGIIHPQTAWGVSFLYAILRFLSWPIVVNTLMKFGGPPSNAFDLPSYSF